MSSSGLDSAHHAVRVCHENSELAESCLLHLWRRVGCVLCGRCMKGADTDAPPHAQVAGGGAMQLRSSDPRFLNLVDAWWRQLLPRIAPLTYARGGPVILVQARPPGSPGLLTGSCLGLKRIGAGKRSRQLHAGSAYS